MLNVNQTPPDRMTVEQRRQELAELLARGIARLRLPPENRSELAIPREGSVHAVPNPKN